MNKLPVFLLLSLLPAACDKVPINGDLDGMWQVMTIQTPQGTRDMKAERAYLSFQLHLTQWSHGGAIYYAHFSHDGDSIFFYDFAHESLHRTQADDNEWITAAEMAGGILDPWGVHRLDARYRVRQLDGDGLTLQRDDTLLHFRRF